MVETQKAMSHLHHTSISCILEQYFDFQRNLNFQHFLKKIAFLGIFLKIAKNGTVRAVFPKISKKIRFHLKCFKITQNCSNKVGERLRDSSGLVLYESGAYVRSCNNLKKLATFVAKSPKKALLNSLKTLKIENFRKNRRIVCDDRI